MSNKRNHAQKVLHKMTKRMTNSGQEQAKGGEENSLKQQYDLIREDLLKLRDDLSKGYDMAKGMMDRKRLVNQFLKTK